MNVTMSARSNLVDLLREVPLFSACSRSELKTLARHTAHVDTPPDTVVVRMGEKGDSFYVVTSGEVAVRRIVRGKEKVVGKLGPGGWFGELALLDPAPRNATVVVTQPSSLGVIDVRVFRAMIRDVPSMSEKLLAGMARRLREADLDS